MARILVAEDDPSVRDFLVRALGRHKHEVTAVGDGAAALEALEAESFDLLLADIVMPVVDGVALSLKVAKEFPGLRIVLMTGYANELQRARNLDTLVHRVVGKPFSLEEIHEVVDSALAP